MIRQIPAIGMTVNPLAAVGVIRHILLQTLPHHQKLQILLPVIINPASIYIVFSPLALVRGKASAGTPVARSAHRQIGSKKAQRIDAIGSETAFYLSTLGL